MRVKMYDKFSQKYIDELEYVPSVGDLIKIDETQMSYRVIEVNETRKTCNVQKV